VLNYTETGEKSFLTLQQ